MRFPPCLGVSMSCLVFVLIEPLLKPANPPSQSASPKCRLACTVSSEQFKSQDVDTAYFDDVRALNFPHNRPGVEKFCGLTHQFAGIDIVHIPGPFIAYFL